MEIPANTELFENSTSTAWIDENGILCSISKKAPAQSIEETKKTLEEFKQRFGDKKWCMLIDITHSAPSDKATRDYAAEAIPQIAKAVAMVSQSSLGRMVANLFFGLKPPSYPTKMFSNEKEAKEWLKQYL